MSLAAFEFEFSGFHVRVSRSIKCFSFLIVEQGASCVQRCRTCRSSTDVQHKLAHYVRPSTACYVLGRWGGAQRRFNVLGVKPFYAYSNT